MSEKLLKGHTIKSQMTNYKIVVEKHLGEGGQGDVYSVNYNGDKMALKWYKSSGIGNDPTAFYENLKNNVKNGAPDSAFLWPIDITEWQNGTFGYIMSLRPEGYFEITDFMLRKVSFPSFKIAIDASLNIVSAFRLLHNKGYSYQDLNDGNFFINPKNGKVLICDNDNVAPSGVKTGILGKTRYMAPEIVMNKKMPDNLSDRFSMSIILFILMCLNHPLEGKKSLVPCLTPALQEKLYGSEASFIMNPDNFQNKPDPNIHKNVLKVWPCLPNYMQELFLKSFNKDACESPNRRPKELDFINTLVRFRSEIVKCSCGNEVFVENGKNCCCEKCRNKLNISFKLDLCDYSIPAVSDTRLYKCQVGISNADEALNPIGRIMSKKDNPNMLGLKNLSGEIWNALTPSGKSKKVMPDEVIPLIDGIEFTIGNENIKITKN